MENAKRNRYGRRGSSDQQRSTDGQPPPLCQSPSEQQSDTDPEHASRAGDERKFRNSYSPSPHYPPLSVRAKRRPIQNLSKSHAMKRRVFCS